jgi:hypothetical protein
VPDRGKLIAMISSHQKLLVTTPVLAALALVASGCNNSNNTTGPTPTLVTETFSGSLPQGGTDVHSFTVNSDGNQLLAGFTAIGPATVTSLGVGVAVWDPTSSTCGLNQSQNPGTVGSTAISVQAGQGPYCVRVFDGGNTPIPAGTTATYTIQVQHY